ncbi:peptide/nickel transport system permease protein [Paramicrobacterium humi]|uniref:Peptide/nickel transport system permease protein n=1 Tax=Paramicrobacterium humi TaxID=640635 RepID=A0A1H4P8H5_9MICO|nr:ABC transporter permease [Microbacterium humi]SEC03655.1 peptide/nickel transport system permease protein [Microbacterium humi]
MSTPSVDLVRRRGWARSLLSRPTGLFGLVTTAVLLACAIVSLFWTPYDPILTDVANKWQPPSAAHLLGTDNIGRDIFSVLLAGSRVTVQVAVGSAVVAAIVGVVFAALGALTTRWVREIVAVLIDILIAFPTLLIAMMLASAFGGSLAVVIVAVGISFGVNVGRVTRPEIRRVSRSEFVTAGIAAGLGPVRNLARHVLPNVAPVFIVQLSWCMAVAVLAEAGLSYLGYGAPVSTPSWGRVLAELQTYIGIHPWSVLWPGLAITFTVLGFNLLGDGLRDATDPRLGRPEVITA